MKNNGVFYEEEFVIGVAETKDSLTYGYVNAIYLSSCIQTP
jgi:hypothetical protein